MATMERVRRHLTAAAEAHRRTHQEALLAAAVARAEQDAQNPPEPPQTGLQPPPGVSADLGGD